MAVLAGGQAKRLGGRPKGLMRLHGQTLIDRLKALGGRATLLVGDALEPYAPFEGLQPVRDLEAGRGAPGGVVSALAAAPTDWVLVVTCDMPFVTASAVAPLLQAAGEGVECVHFVGERFPLLARRRLATTWRSMLLHEPSVKALLEAAGARAVSPTEPNVSRSVNTVEEAQTLRIDLQ